MHFMLKTIFLLALLCLFSCHSQKSPTSKVSAIKLDNSTGDSALTRFSPPTNLSAEEKELRQFVASEIKTVVKDLNETPEYSISQEDVTTLIENGDLDESEYHELLLLL